GDLEAVRSAAGQVEHVVVEAVLLVPQLDPGDVVQGARDVDEVLEELGGDVLVGGVVPGELERDRQHVEAVHAHPGGAVGLFDVASGGERRGAVDGADVVTA